jgi:hypothetical protein
MRSLVLTILVALGAASGAFAQGGLDPVIRDHLAEKKLMICFQGKGSCLPYDAGVLRAMYERVPAMSENKVIVSGNSSGSILAAYFANYGFTEANLKYAEYRLMAGGIEAIRKMEQGSTKALKMVRGEKTELPHIEMKEFIAFALGVEDWRSANSIEEIVAKSTALPRFPVIIVAGNREVMENRGTGTPFAAKNHRTFDMNNFSISWKPEVLAYYRANPDEFARDYPDLKLGDSTYIGKSCTFFVDRSMYELLKQIPENERIADLRLMETPADLALAILASVSEPTYFDPIEDKEPGKILSAGAPGELGAVKRRTYCGGFLISLPAQDVKRMLPAIRVAGSGWTHNPTMARRLLQAWYLADTEDVAHMTDYWADSQFNPTREMRAAMVAKSMKAPEEFASGKASADKGLANDRAFPVFVNRPTYYYPAAAAILPSGDDSAYLEAPDAAGKRKIKVGQGLGPLLAPPAK